MTRKDELLALANSLDFPFAAPSPKECVEAAAALREYAAMLDAEPVAIVEKYAGSFKDVVEAIAANVYNRAFNTAPEPVACNLGVGCDEAGVCYAEAHGHPEQCPREPASAQQWRDQLRELIDELAVKDQRIAALEAKPEKAPEPVAFMNGDALLSFQAGNDLPVRLSRNRTGWFKTAIYTHTAPAPTTQKVCHGIPRIGCNYLAECGTVCNKCGKVHLGVHMPAPDAQPLEDWDSTLKELKAELFERELHRKTRETK